MKIKDTELFFLGKTLSLLAKNIINQKTKWLSVCRIIYFLSTLTTNCNIKIRFMSGDNLTQCRCMRGNQFVFNIPVSNKDHQNCCQSWRDQRVTVFSSWTQELYNLNTGSYVRISSPQNVNPISITIYSSPCRWKVLWGPQSISEAKKRQRENTKWLHTVLLV